MDTTISGRPSSRIPPPAPGSVLSRTYLPLSLRSGESSSRAGEVALVSPLGVAAAGLREPAADHVADADDRDIEPCTRGRERIDVRVAVSVALPDDPRPDQ